MTVVNVYEAKTHLSRLLRRVRAGEQIVIADAGTPIARLVPLAADSGPRVLGGDEGRVRLADDFDAALPSDVIADFWGSTPEATTKRGAARKGKARARPAKKSER